MLSGLSISYVCPTDIESQRHTKAFFIVTPETPNSLEKERNGKVAKLGKGVTSTPHYYSSFSSIGSCKLFNLEIISSIKIKNTVLVFSNANKSSL